MKQLLLRNIAGDVSALVDRKLTFCAVPVAPFCAFV
jgi:hypothetical protein